MFKDCIDAECTRECEGRTYQAEHFNLSSDTEESNRETPVSSEKLIRVLGQKAVIS